MSESFDYVIVGAGSAGCVLANRLSADGATVALVEAGGRDSNPYIHIPVGYFRLMTHPRINWGFSTEPDAATAHRALDYPRGRVWGGSSSINGLGHVRGHPSDYDLWAQKGCTGWGWDGLLPYFKKHESFGPGGEERGTDGPQPIEHISEMPPIIAPLGAAARAIGLPVQADMNGPEREGFSTFQQTRRGKRRVSAARAYLHPVLSRPNLRVVSNAMALRIVIEDGRATGVVIRQGGTERMLRARREVILAAGAIGSPQLLMLSGLGPAAQLAEHGIAVARDMPGIGANLQDHYITRLNYRLADHRWSANRRIGGWRLAREAARWLALGTGVLTWSPGMFSLFARTLPGLEAPDIQINGGPISWRVDGDVAPPEYGTLRVGTPDPQPGLTLGVWQCRPHSRGSVSLRGPRAEDAPRIAPRHLSAREDQEAAVRGIRLARRWMAAAPLAAIVTGEARPGAHAETDEELLAFARATGGTVYHPCGTVRMGGDPAAPLDARLRLRGVVGLRVVDASVFPDIPVCNINATVLAVAEKAADLILEDSRAG